MIIIFILTILLIIFFSYLYVKEIGKRNRAGKLDLLIRLCVVILLCIIYYENLSQSNMLSKVSSTIQTYLSDAGKTIITFIDNRTKEIDKRLNNIDEKLDKIDGDIVSVENDMTTLNKNINNSYENIIKKINNETQTIIETLGGYIDKKFNEYVDRITSLGPGGIKTVW